MCISYVIILLMSEQKDGMLQLPSSHNFNRDVLSNYRTRTIDPNSFLEWSKKDMYRSSYAQHHSPVLHLQSSNPASHEPIRSLAMEASSPTTEPRVYTEKHMPIRQKTPWTTPTPTAIEADSPPQDWTSLKMHSSISPNTPVVTSMENQKSSSLILDGW